MKLYQKLIRPMHSYPGPDYSPRVTPIEKEEIWYPEEERERLKKKYDYLNEGSFSDLVFDEKYEPYAIEPNSMLDIEKTIRVLETMLMTVHTSLSETERDAIRTAAELLKEQKAKRKNRLPYSSDSNVQWT